MNNLKISLVVIFFTVLCYNIKAVQNIEMSQSTIEAQTDCNVILLVQSRVESKEFTVEEIVLNLKIYNSEGNVVFKADGGNCNYVASLLEYDAGLYTIEFETEEGTVKFEIQN